MKGGSQGGHTPMGSARAQTTTVPATSGTAESATYSAAKARTDDTTRSPAELHDPFYALTPRRPLQPWLIGQVALLTVDVQVLAADKGGWMGRLASAAGLDNLLAERWANIDAAIPSVVRLQAEFRRAGAEVIHIRTAFLKSDFSDAGRSYMPHPSTAVVLPDASDYEFLVPVAPLVDEMVFSKRSSSAFNSTDLDDVLRRMKLESLVVCGVVTDGCVELTARDAADRGYEVILVSDACASSRQQTHLDALGRMSEGGLIHLMEASSVVARLRNAAHVRQQAGA